MDYLHGKSLYLSAPIENHTGPNWRTSVKNVLIDRFKLDVFDPFDDPKQNFAAEIEEARKRKDFKTMQKISKGFVRKDLIKVDKTDILVAFLPYKVATVGVCHEIINSNNAKKPTLLVAEAKELIPFWYFGFIKLEFMFGGWENLYQYLDEVNSGKHMHNDRWSFIYGLV